MAVLPNGNNNCAMNTAMATPSIAVGTIGMNSKKSKKKNNNVWVTKSKKKNKRNNSNNNNHGTNGEDMVLITPVWRFPDKSDDTPKMKICLLKVYKAEKVELSEDRMVEGSTKGPNPVIMPCLLSYQSAAVVAASRRRMRNGTETSPSWGDATLWF